MRPHSDSKGTSRKAIVLHSHKFHIACPLLEAEVKSLHMWIHTEDYRAGVNISSGEAAKFHQKQKKNPGLVIFRS